MVLKFLAAALSLATQAQAGAQPPPPIVGGATTTDYPAVVYISSYNSGGYGGLCSGTLISPRWIVTAAHCVEDWTGSWTMEIIFGHNVYSSWGIDRTRRVSEWVIHPQYSYSAGRIQNDIALVKMADSVWEVDPMPVNDRIGSGWLDEDIRYVGFGITGTGRNDSGTKRFVDVPVYDYDPGTIYTIDPGGKNICSGDSGGAALMALPGGGWELVGVNSYGFSSSGSDTCAGGGGGSMRVDVHLDWIENYVDFDVVESDEEEDDVGGSGGGSDDGGASDGDDSEYIAPNFGFSATEEKGGCSSAGQTSIGHWGWILSLVALARRRQA